MLLSVVSAPAALASQTTIQGPESRVQLVELFTSEGCSSCPRADATLLDLESHPDLWRTFAPVGLHVDYWDRLGWRDRFATVRNGQRQRNYARAGLASGAYTPGWFVGGQEWRGENRGRTLNHAFVAMSQAQAEFVSGTGVLELPEANNEDVPTRRAVVAWVTRADNPVPLQAVGGWPPTPPRCC